MKTSVQKTSYIALAFSWFLVGLAGVCSAEIYKYQDEKGVWHYTDQPPEDAKKVELEEFAVKKLAPEDIEKHLYDTFNPENAIDQAALGVVEVKTLLISGLGFFVTKDGFILTNRHIIKPDETNAIREMEEAIARLQKEVDATEKKLELERKGLSALKEKLDDEQEAIRREGIVSKRRAKQEEYEQTLKKYEAWKKDFETRSRAFTSKKEKLEDMKRDFSFQRTAARLKQNFTAILKDGTELNASLVSVSENFDLALLKVDGHKTPYIPPADLGRISPGMDVYMIGSPQVSGEAVIGGIIMRFESGYIIKTDIQVSSRNTGAPLINAEGEVVGISTTRPEAGVPTHPGESGSAILLPTAIGEFGGYLGER